MCAVYCEASRTVLLSCSVMTLNIDLSGNISFLFWTIFHGIVKAMIAIADVSLGLVRPHSSICRVNEQVVPIIDPREEGGGAVIFSDPIVLLMSLL